jgi:hypothetical protein
VIRPKSIELFEESAIALQQYSELLYAIAEHHHPLYQMWAAHISALSRTHVDALHMALRFNAGEP